MTKSRVLIVDDEAPIRLLVRVNLEAEGYEVIEAADGLAAVAVAKEEKPDVVLLDVMMPFKDGWEVAQDLLGDETTNHIPILFLTARADLRDHEKGLVTGALQYITKPFNPRDLAPAIEAALEASRKGDAQTLRDQRLQAVRDMQVLPE